MLMHAPVLYFIFTIEATSGIINISYETRDKLLGGLIVLEMNKEINIERRYNLETGQIL